MAKRKCGIYIIRFKGTDFFYIGQSTNIDSRWNSHLDDLRGQRHSNPKMQNIFNKFGHHSFTPEIALLCPKSQLDANEQKLINESWGNPYLINLQKYVGKRRGPPVRRRTKAQTESKTKNRARAPRVSWTDPWLVEKRRLATLKSNQTGDHLMSHITKTQVGE